MRIGKFRMSYCIYTRLAWNLRLTYHNLGLTIARMESKIPLTI